MSLFIEKRVEEEIKEEKEKEMFDLQKIPLPWVQESYFLETLLEDCDVEAERESILHLPAFLGTANTFSSYLYDMLRVDGSPYLEVAIWIDHYQDVLKLFDYLHMKKPLLAYIRPGYYGDWREATMRLGVPLQGLQKIAFGWTIGVQEALVESMEESDLRWIHWYWQEHPNLSLTSLPYFTPRRCTRELVAFLESNASGRPLFTPRFCEELIQYRNREVVGAREYKDRIKKEVAQDRLFQLAFERRPGETKEEHLEYIQFMMEHGYHFYQDIDYILHTFRSKNVRIWEFLHQLYPQRFQYNIMQLYHTLQELTIQTTQPYLTFEEKREMAEWIRAHYPVWWEELRKTHTQSLYLPLFLLEYYGKPTQFDDAFMEYLFCETHSTRSPMYYVYSVILKGRTLSEEEMHIFHWKEEWHTIQYPAFRLAIHHNHLPSVQYMVKHHYYSDVDDTKHAILWAVPHQDIFRYLWKRYFRYHHYLFHEDRQRHKESIYYYLYEARQLENIQFLMEQKVNPPRDFLRFVQGEKVHLDFYLEHAGVEAEPGEVQKMREEVMYIERVLAFVSQRT
jgi:hypothetical protein